MIKIKKLFDFKTGNLPALELTDEGKVPLVYGSAYNSGVVKFVSVDNSLDIFKPPLITVSYLGTAFVQVVPFTTSVVDKSNIIVLEPKEKMTLSELYFYAYQINKHGQFGFSYGRRMNMARLSKLSVFKFDEKKHKYEINFSKFMPTINLEPYKNLKLKKIVSILSVFEIINAKSKGYDSYFEGEIPFISNGLDNNGIVGWISPLPKDRVIHKKSICISAFCEATVQDPPYLPRGNGGSGLTVLVPKLDMSNEQLIFYASYINKFIKWRFSYGRMVTLARVNKLEVPLII